MKKLLTILIAGACLALPSHAFAKHGADDNGGDSHGGKGGESAETVVRGPIVSIDASSIVVGTTTFVIDLNTVFKDKQDVVTTIAAFAGGDFVKVEGTGSPTLTAKEVELEDDHSTTDDNKKSGKKLGSGEIVGKCEFPELDLVRQSLERAIKTSYADAGKTVRVKIKARITSKDPAQVFSGASASNGVTLAVDTASTTPVTLTGTITPTTCQGVASLRVEVKDSADGSKTTSTASLPVQGLFVAKDDGHHSGHK